MQQVDAGVTAFPFVSFSFRGDNFLTTHPISNPFSYLYSLQFYLRNKTHFPYILKYFYVYRQLMYIDISNLCRYLYQFI